MAGGTGLNEGFAVELVASRGERGGFRMTFGAVVFALQNQSVRFFEVPESRARLFNELLNHFPPRSQHFGISCGPFLRNHRFSYKRNGF